MKSKIEKIAKGYKLAKIDWDYFEYSKKMFVCNHIKLCGGKEEVYNAWTQFGGVLRYIANPLRGYKIIRDCINS